MGFCIEKIYLCILKLALHGFFVCFVFVFLFWVIFYHLLTAPSRWLRNDLYTGYESKESNENSMNCLDVF